MHSLDCSKADSDSNSVLEMLFFRKKIIAQQQKSIFHEFSVHLWRNTWKNATYKEEFSNSGQAMVLAIEEKILHGFDYINS